MVLVELESWELHVLGAIPLVEFTLFAQSFLVIIDAALQAGISGITANKLHSFQQEIMLVHVGDELESQLNLFECVSNNSVVCTTALISTGVLASRRLLNKLSHSFIHISLRFLFRRSHHAALNMCHHEENQRHDQEHWDRAEQEVNLVLLGWISLVALRELLNLHRVCVNHLLEPVGRLGDPLVPHLITHIDFLII